jgi:hypothetical protein
MPPMRIMIKYIHAIMQHQLFCPHFKEGIVKNLRSIKRKKKGGKRRKKG